MGDTGMAGRGYYKEGRKFVIDFVLRGEREKVRTDITNEREIKAEVARRRELIAERVKRVRGVGVVQMTIEQAFNRYWIEKGQHGKDAKNVEADLFRTGIFLGKETMLCTISDSEVAELVSWRQAQFRYFDPKHGLISFACVNRSATQLLKRVMLRARDVWNVPIARMPRWRRR
jgi:hypothetical protein